MTSRTQSPSQHRRQPATEGEFARAEADYQRLRQAYLELARGDHNEVALAMVGADMERAHALRQGGQRQLRATEEPSELVKREARRLAEADA